MDGRKKRNPKQQSAIHDYHVRLFREDVQCLREKAEERGLKWQVLLRLSVRDLAKGLRANLRVMKEQA